MENKPGSSSEREPTNGIKVGCTNSPNHFFRYAASISDLVKESPEIKKALHDFLDKIIDEKNLFTYEKIKDGLKNFLERLDKRFPDEKSDLNGDILNYFARAKEVEETRKAAISAKPRSRNKTTVKIPWTKHQLVQAAKVVKGEINDAPAIV